MGKAAALCSPCVATCGRVCVCVGGGWLSYEENIWIYFHWCAVAEAAFGLLVCVF